MHTVSDHGQRRIQMSWFVTAFEKQILQRIFTFSQNTEKYRSRVSALQFSHRISHCVHSAVADENNIRRCMA